MNYMEATFLGVAALVAGLVAFDGAAPDGYMHSKIVTAESGPGLDEARVITEGEKRDLLFMVSNHVGVNALWLPKTELDWGEVVNTRLVTLPQAQLSAWCGSDAMACAYNLSAHHGTDSWVEFIEHWNTDVTTERTPKLVGDECVIFMPGRVSDMPMSWFYLMGHEYSHCTYGAFHTITPVDFDGNVGMHGHG